MRTSRQGCPIPNQGAETEKAQDRRDVDSPPSFPGITKPPRQRWPRGLPQAGSLGFADSLATEEGTCHEDHETVGTCSHETIAPIPVGTEDQRNQAEGDKPCDHGAGKCLMSTQPRQAPVQVPPRYSAVTRIIQFALTITIIRIAQIKPCEVTKPVLGVVGIPGKRFCPVTVGGHKRRDYLRKKLLLQWASISLVIVAYNTGQIVIVAYNTGQIDDWPV